MSAVVSVIGLIAVLAGIVLLYMGKTQQGFITAASGVLGEFISSVFFYLFSQTVLKMSEYHQKLVITQNIAIALKIADEIEDKQIQEKTLQDIIEQLTNDVNWYLVGPKGEKPAKASTRANARQRTKPDDKKKGGQETN